MQSQPQDQTHQKNKKKVNPEPICWTFYHTETKTQKPSKKEAVQADEKLKHRVIHHHCTPFDPAPHSAPRSRDSIYEREKEIFIVKCHKQRRARNGSAQFIF